MLAAVSPHISISLFIYLFILFVLVPTLAAFEIQEADAAASQDV